MARTMLLSAFLAVLVVASAYDYHRHDKWGTCPVFGKNNGQECRRDSDCPFILKCCYVGYSLRKICFFPRELQSTYSAASSGLGYPQIPSGLGYSQASSGLGFPQISSGLGNTVVPSGQGYPQFSSGLHGINPILPVGKRGVCPPPRGFGICVSLCSHDFQCPGIQKCCSNGCGHVCSRPVGHKKVY